MIGIIPSSINSGNSGVVNILGVASGLSGLTVGVTYYLSNTGTLTTTAGTYSKKVGISDSATELQLMLTAN